MKLFLLSLGLFICSTTLNAQKMMELNIELESDEPISRLYLEKGPFPFNNENLVDSTVPKNNRATFRFKVDEIGFYIVRQATYKNGNLLRFFATPGEKASVKWKLPAVAQPTRIYTNSPANELVETKFATPYSNAIKTMNAYFDSIRSTNDSSLQSYYRKQNHIWGDSMKNLQLNFVRQYPRHYQALFYLNAYFREFSDAFVADFLKNLPKSLKNNSLAKELALNKFTIEKIKHFSSFPLLDSSGKKFDYTPYLNHIVLVDFWASWCKPCLENIPKIDSIRLKFKDSGLKILGVSIDKNSESWKKALRREQLHWENVIDPKANDGLTSVFFRLSTIPRYALIGKDGTILNKNLKIEEAEEAIATALNKK